MWGIQHPPTPPHAAHTPQGDKNTLRALEGQPMKLLNLAADWLTNLLPHVLSKINRVGFGVLAPHDLALCHPRMPVGRRLMAVPFVGKDVPSRSSEFAHPDVLIGLTILAYRYDGVRKTDLRRVVEQLKKDFGRDVGPPEERRSSMLFRSWLEGAQERIRLSRERRDAPALTPTTPSVGFDAFLNTGATNTSVSGGGAANTPNMSGIKGKSPSSGNLSVSADFAGDFVGEKDDAMAELGVYPLSLFQPNDPQQLERLYRAIKRHPPFIHYYLRNHVFPTCMNFQLRKISASGQELG